MLLWAEETHKYQDNHRATKLTLFGNDWKIAVIILTSFVNLSFIEINLNIIFVDKNYWISSSAVYLRFLI